MNIPAVKSAVSGRLSPQATQQLMALAALVILYVYFAIFGRRFLSPSTFVFFIFQTAHKPAANSRYLSRIEYSS